MVRSKIMVLCCLVLSNMLYALESYQASYRVNVRGISAGKMDYKAFFTDTFYQIDSKATPSSAVKILGYSDSYESVKGTIHNKKTIPTHYQRTMKNNVNYRLIYDFDAKNRRINAQIGKAQKQFSYDADNIPLDTLSMITQALIDIENKSVPNSYTLISDDSIKIYQIKKAPDQLWKQPNGQSVLVHVYHQTSGSRETRIYFADNPLRLLQLTQYRRGNLRFSMELTDYATLQ